MTEDEFVIGFKMYAQWVHKIVGDELPMWEVMHSWVNKLTPFLDDEIHRALDVYRKDRADGEAALRAAWRIENSPLMKALS